MKESIFLLDDSVSMLIEGVLTNVSKILVFLSFNVSDLHFCVCVCARVHI